MPVQRVDLPQLYGSTNLSQGGDSVPSLAREWQRQAKALIRTLGKDRETMLLAYESLARDMFDEIVRRTPVDTDFAMSHWKGPNMKRSTKGTGGFLTNSVPYIVMLEYGWSGQAPFGMVRITLHEATVEFESAMRRLVQHRNRRGI